jgi:putative tricarboxylic transport membrane protein
MWENDSYAAVILLVFCGIVYGVASSYPDQSAYFPRIIIVLLASMSAALLGRAFLARRRERAERQQGQPQAARKLAFWKREVFRKVVLMVAGAMIFIGVMDFAGFYLTSMVYLPLMTWLLGVRKPRTILLSSFAVLFFIYLVFTAFLRVPLPEGIAF